MKISLDLTYHCEHPTCDATFRARAPLQAIVEDVPVVPELPPGWAMEDVQINHWEAEVQLRCKVHRRDAAVTVVDERIVPSPEIIARAKSLQALAMDNGATDNERANAWSAFEKLWHKYRLPEDLGIE